MPATMMVAAVSIGRRRANRRTSTCPGSAGESARCALQAVEPIARGDEKQTRADESGGHASAVRHDEHGAEPGTAQGDAPEQHQQG